MKAEIDEGNVYPIFAGGDDCFLIGAWNKILPLAFKIQQAFDEFQNDITISAGIIVINPRFPVVRLAEEAEKALESAKENGKNRITIFDEVLKWEDIKCAEDLSTKLIELINDGESRAVLERIRSSEIGFLSLQKRTVKKAYYRFPKSVPAEILSAQCQKR